MSKREEWLQRGEKAASVKAARAASSQGQSKGTELGHTLQLGALHIEQRQIQGGWGGPVLQDIRRSSVGDHLKVFRGGRCVGHKGSGGRPKEPNGTLGLSLS